MGLNWVSLQLLRPHAKGRVLCFGYPDILIPREHCVEVLGFMPEKFVPVPAWCKRYAECPDARAVFAGLGAELVVVDAIAHEGTEIVADLNEPHELGEFGLVIDAGTIEHCMNIGQALVNMAKAVKVGGRILHCSPATMMNHGFYNLCPTLFWHFYEANGFEMKHAHARDGKGEGDMFDIAAHGRFMLPENCGLYVMAKRMEKKPFVFPMQSKYAQ